MQDFKSFQKCLGNNIWIVGSGGLDRIPAPGCHCILCEAGRKGGKDRRIPASSIFYKGVLFDAGPSVWKRILNKGVIPKAIVLSHVHFDHIADLLIYPLISKRIPIYTSVLHETLFTRLKIRARYFRPGKSFNPVPDLKIRTRIGTHSFVRPVSLLRFDNIIYAPDLGTLTTLDKLFAKGVKIWFGDGFCFDKNFTYQDQKLHFSVQNLLLGLKNLKSLEKVILLSIGHHSRYPHEDYELIIQQFCLNKKIPFHVKLGWDNQLIKKNFK